MTNSRYIMPPVLCSRDARVRLGLRTLSLCADPSINSTLPDLLPVIRVSSARFLLCSRLHQQIQRTDNTLPCQLKRITLLNIQHSSAKFFLFSAELLDSVAGTLHTIAICLAVGFHAPAHIVTDHPVPLAASRTLECAHVQTVSK
jgi:hypothetical protein